MDIEFNILLRLKTVTEDHPDRVALVVGNEETSYRGLWTRITGLAGGFRSIGLKADDRAVCMIPMSIDLYAGMLALLKNGIAVVFVDPWLGRKAIADMAVYAEPSAWIGIPKSHVLRLMDRRLRAIPQSVTTDRTWAGLPAAHSFHTLESGPADETIEPRSPESAGLITFTSGSSGTPKGANRAHGFLLSQHEALKECFPYEDTDVDMPMFPVFALNNLAWGIVSVVPDMDFRNVAGVDGKRIYEQMIRHGVTTSTASPPFFDRLCEYLAESGSTAPSLRRILTGGAPVSDEQLVRWARHLPETEIIIVYGSTEAEPVAHLHATERLNRRSATRPLTPGYCTGKPVGAVDTAVIRITGDPVEDLEAARLAQGEIGELIVTGNHVCREYFRNPEAGRANKIRSSDGRIWHRMGDTGYMDPDGYFWLTGRVHSTILRDGEMHHPQLIEQAVTGCGVRQCAAVGVPDTALGNRVVLVVKGDEPDLIGLREQIQQAGLLVDEIRPRSGPLPVDPRHNSKIDYDRLREELGSDG